VDAKAGMIHMIYSYKVMEIMEREMAAAGRIGVAHLSEGDRKRIRGELPDLTPDDPALVISAPQSVLDAIEELVQYLAWESDRSSQVLDLLTEDVGSRVLSPSRLEQLRLQAKAREHFLATYPTLTSSEVAELGGSRARNKSAIASRWKQEGKIFAISDQSTDRYPLFQFGQDGKPLPVMEDILRLFEGENAWTIALWFAAASDWLENDPPAERVARDPAAVLEAARHSAEPLEI
jgi:hypothetical protein